MFICFKLHENNHVITSCDKLENILFKVLVYLLFPQCSKVFATFEWSSKIFGYLRKSLKGYRLLSGAFGNVRLIFVDLGKGLGELRPPSKYLGWSSIVFECLRTKFGCLRCNLLWCSNLHWCYMKTALFF